MISNTKWHSDGTNGTKTMDALLKGIGTKLLEFKRNKAKDIVEKGNTATIERHRDALVALAKEVDVVKGKIKEKKLEGGE